MPDELILNRKQRLLAAVPDGEKKNIGLVAARVYDEDTPENRKKLIPLLFFVSRNENFSFRVRDQKSPDGVVWRENVPNKKINRTIKINQKKEPVPINQTQTADIDALNIINQRIQALRRMSQLFTEPQRVGVFISEVDNLIIKLLTK